MYPAAILVEIPVDAIVTAVFNAPVVTVRLEVFVGAGLLGLTAGDAANCFLRDLPGVLFDAFAFDHKDRANSGEVEVAIEFG